MLSLAKLAKACAQASSPDVGAKRDLAINAAPAPAKGAPKP